MTDSHDPPDRPEPPPSRRHGCLTALMIVAGIILLLPGLCALLFSGILPGQAHFGWVFNPFVVVGVLVGIGGIVLIVVAIRGLRS
jgi:hypothetical protein